MLPRHHRIPRALERNTSRPSARSRSEYIQCSVFLRLDQKSPSRFSFTVGKNVSKLAVARNTMRRRISAVTEKHLSEFRPGLDVHIRVLRDIRKFSHPELEKALFQIFHDAETLL